MVGGRHAPSASGSLCLRTIQGYPIWQAMDQSAYAWEALKMLPEEIREKREVQLLLNLAEIMESLGDGLTKQAFIASHLRGSARAWRT